MLKSSRSVSLPALQETDAGEFAYADWGTPGQVVKRDVIEDFGLTTVRFGNNVRLTLKTTPYEEDLIRIRVRAGDGSGQFDPSDRSFPIQMSSVINRSGLGAHDADSLQTVLAGRTVGARRSFGQEAMSLSATTVPDDLELQMQLLAAYLTDPGFREEVVPTYQSQIRQVWSKADTTPSGAASRYIPRILQQDHPVSQIASEEDLIDVDLQALRSWYEDNVRGGPIEIAVVGDIDEEAVIDAVARTFGTLEPRPDPTVNIRPDSIDYRLVDGRAEPFIVRHRGDDDTALVRIYWPTPNHEDVRVDRLIGMVDNVLGLELTDRVREGEGASYSPSSYSIRPEHAPDYGMVAASVEVAPDEVERIAALIVQTARDIAADGVSDDLFDRAIMPVLERLETSLENNTFWLGLADEAQSDPDSLDHYRTLDSMYQNMTADDVTAMARDIFTGDEPIRVYVLPEE